MTITNYKLIVDLDMDPKDIYNEKHIEFLASVNSTKKEGFLKLGFKKWCVFLEKFDKTIYIQSFDYKKVCAMNENLPKGQYGTVPMLKVAIKLALNIWKSVDNLEFTDNSGFYDLNINKDRSLSTRDMCIYQQTWYQRYLGKGLQPTSERDKYLIQKYLSCLSANIEDEFRNSLDEDVETKIINLDCNTYSELIYKYYRKYDNRVYHDIIIHFMKFCNLRSLEGVNWKIQISDIDFSGINIHIEPYSESIQFGYGPGGRYIEKVKFPLEKIARDLAFIDPKDFDSYLDFQLSEGNLDKNTIKFFR